MFICFILKACEHGSYGVDCKGICGQCRDINQCFHINGTCLTGCDVGYQGKYCKTRRYISRLKICQKVFVLFLNINLNNQQ